MTGVRRGLTTGGGGGCRSCSRKARGQEAVINDDVVAWDDEHFVRSRLINI